MQSENKKWVNSPKYDIISNEPGNIKIQFRPIPAYNPLFDGEELSGILKEKTKDTKKK